MLGLWGRKGRFQGITQKFAVFGIRSLLLLGAFSAFAVTNAFSPIAGSLSLRRALPSVVANRSPLSLLSVSCGPKPIHTKFTVEKATEEQVIRISLPLGIA